MYRISIYGEKLPLENSIFITANELKKEVKELSHQMDNSINFK